MHELALAQQLLSIIERVAREHSARRVTAARLEIGELSCVEPRALAFAFELASKGSLAEGCELVMERVPLIVSCRGCGWEGPGNLEEPGCPDCGAPSLGVVSGRELRLLTIDTEGDHDA